MNSLAVIGECMLEFRQHGNAFELGYGGDVFNTAVYASRKGLDVGFLSATGDDDYSAYLVDSWQKEGILTDSVRIIPNTTPGLYIINTDATGERSFHYWRDSTPFKQWLNPGDYLTNLPTLLASYECVYFSGISLALLSEDDKQKMLDLLSAHRGDGGMVAFDPNYRARLWRDKEHAQLWIDRAYEICSLALPSYDDEVLLRDNITHTNLMAHIHKLGVDEVVLKDGEQGASISTNGHIQTVASEHVTSVVDTTAAGDSFNGGYLAQRLQGGTPTSAAESGCRIAATVIQHRGAIIQPDITLP